MRHIVAFLERKMWNLNDLNFYSAVVQHGGFSSASRALGIPKSRISRRVAALEDDLGVRLIERSARRFKVTALGQDVYLHARAAVAEADTISEIISRVRAEPQGLVRISCPLGLDRLLARSTPQFLAQYPKIRLQVIATNRRMDIIEDGIDIAVRIRPQLDGDADLQVKIAGPINLMLVASPRFASAYGLPNAPEDLPRFPTISRSESSGTDRWRLTNTTGETREIVHEPRLISNAFHILASSAIQGLGIAPLPEYACREALDSGQLLPIIPDWKLGESLIHLVFTSRRGLLPSVRAAIDYFGAALKPNSMAWQSRDLIAI